MDKLLPATMQRASEDSQAEEKQDVFVPWKLQGRDGRTQDEAEVHQRYYHLFTAGELKDLVEDAAREMHLQDSLTVEPEHWEEGNWWIRAGFD